MIDFGCSHETNISAAALPFLFNFVMHLTCIYCIVHASSTRLMSVNCIHSMGEYDPALLCVELKTTSIGK